MHDIDRTMGRTNLETFEFQGEGEEELQGEGGYAAEFQGEEEFEGEFQGEGEEELAGEFQGEEEYAAEFQGEEEYAAEFQGEEEYAAEFQGEEEFEGEGEEELNELAAELLSVTNEQELQQFLGGLVSRVGGAVSNFARSPVGRQLGGALRNVAKQALPIAGQAIGNYLAPGVGGAIGQRVGSAAGQIFGLELEGLSHEDRDFEVAKQFVRLAADAAQTAMDAPPGSSPNAVVRHALTQASQQYAPGLLDDGRRARGRGAQTGQWVRRGQNLIVRGL